MSVARVARFVAVAGMLVTALPALSQAQGNGNPYFEFLIARHLESEGDNAGALAALERAAVIDPKSAEVQAEIASFHYRRNQRDLAEKAGKAALALDEKNVEANRILGLLAAASADNARNTPAQAASAIRDAIAYLEKAVNGTVGLTDPTLNFTLGRLYLRSNAADKAIQALARVVNQNPNSVQGRLLLAQAQAANKDVQGAITTLDEIVEEEPRVASALGQYQEQAGQLREAAQSYTTALEVQPTNRDLKVRRVVVLYEAKDYVKAAQFAADAQQQHPDDSRFPRLQASALFASGDRTRAMGLLEATIKTFPKDTASHLALVDMYSNTGRRDDAEKVLRQVIAVDPSNADALNYLGYMLAERGDRLDEAIQLVTRALQADPDNGAYLDSLGWAHFRKGDLPQAEKYLTQAAEKLPRNAEIQEHLGDVLARQSRWQDAIDAWNRALQGDGANRDSLQKKIADARTKARR